MAKGICIFCVMISHSGFSCKGVAVDFFFLSGFFFASGYCYKEEYSIRTRCLKIVNTIVVPYILWSIITFFGVRNNLLMTYNNGIDVFIEYFCEILRGMKLWFLPCLVCIELLYMCLCHFIKMNQTKRVLLFLLSLSTAFWVNNECGRILFWHFDTACYSLSYFVLGRLLANTTKSLEIVRTVILFPTTILFLLISYFLMQTSCIGMNLSLNNLNSIYVVVPMNILGCYLLYSVSKRIPENKYLILLGKNSLLLFCIHWLFFSSIIKLLPDNLFVYINNSAGCILFVYLMGLFLLSLIKYINKYFPVLTGKLNLVKF